MNTEDGDGDNLIEMGLAAYDHQQQHKEHITQESTQTDDVIMCNICSVKFYDAKNMFADLLLHFNNFHPHCMKADIQVNHGGGNKKEENIGDEILGLPPVPNIEEDYQDAADVVNQNIKQQNDQGYGYDPRASLPGRYTTIYEVPVGLRQYLKRRALTSVEVLVKPYICIECGHLCTNLKTALRHLCQNHNFILRGDHVWSQACRQHGFAPKTSPQATIKSVSDDAITHTVTSHGGGSSEENDDDVINKARHQRSLKRHHRSNDDVTKSDGSPPRKRNISTKFVLRGGTWMHADRLNQEKLAEQERQQDGGSSPIERTSNVVGGDVNEYDVT